MAKHRIYNGKKSQSQKTQNINRFTFPTDTIIYFMIDCDILLYATNYNVQ